MWPDAEKTQELLERAQAGEDDAVNRLLQRHRDTLRRIVAVQLDPMLRRRLDASDIVQDVLIEANRRLGDYLEKPVVPFHVWLRQLARDHLIAAHRKHRVAKKRTVDRERPIHAPVFSDRSSLELAQQLVADGLTPAAVAMRAELQKRFAEAIEELGPDDREVILMRHFEQLTNQEASTALGISEQAASMRYLRAIRRLRTVLEPESKEETP